MITKEQLDGIIHDLEAERLEGISKNSMIKVTCNGNLEFLAVKINQKAAPSLTKEELQTLEEKVLGAIIDASSKQKALVQQRLGKC